jgi:predicted NBD/HSP70 family sugar kinase
VGFAEASTRQRASTLAVLDFAWGAGEFRADHAIAASGLTRSTVLAALDSLIEIGLVRELPSAVEEGSRIGRPARRFELNAGAGVVIGIDAGFFHFTTIAADLAGRVLARDETSVGAGREDPKVRRRLVLAAVKRVLLAAGRSADDVFGVGIGVPAPVNGSGVSPPNPDDFWQHMNAGLQSALEESFPAVRVENDATLAAIAEGAGGAGQGHDHFVTVLVGRRLGAAVFLEGQIVRGAHGAVGELEALSFVSGVGSAMGLGNRAEEWARRALDEGRIPADHPWALLPPGRFTAEALLAHARPDDPVTGPLLTELGATLGRVCGVLARFYDPEVIIICGSMAGSLGEILTIAREHLAREAHMPPPPIVASAMGGDVVSLGGVSTARDAAREIVLPILMERHEGHNAEEA